MATSPTLAPLPPRSMRMRWFARANPALLPGLVAVGLCVALGASEAGFYPVHSEAHPGLGWYPAGVALMALLGMALVALRPRAVPRPVLAATALLAGFAAWSGFSILWADAQGVAWDGLNRALIYTAVFGLFALWPISIRGAQILMGALGFGIAGVGLVELLTVNGSANPAGFFLDGRLTEPAGYVNANVALWTIGLWPLLYLAATRSVRVPVRGLALGGAGLLAALPLLTQSRGWALALPVALLLWVVITPERGRALVTLGTVGVGVALCAPSLLAVHDDFSPARLDGLVSTATSRVLTMVVLLVLLGTAAALADRRVTAGSERARAVDRGLTLAAGGLVVLALVGATVALGNPVAKVSDSWSSFKRGGEGGTAGSSRFTSAGTNRYDFWRVSWRLFADHPVAGVGSANFQQDYLQRGRSDEQPRYPHSLELGVLSQTGLVGGLLLGGALAAAIVAIVRRRRVGPEVGAAVAGAAAVAGYWLVHASVDWFWEFPGITAPAFAMLGLACSVGRLAPPAAAAREPSTGRFAVTLAAGAAATALVVTSLALPWLAERQTVRATEEFGGSASASYEALDRAASLNPLSPRPRLTEALIAVRTENPARAEQQLRKVVELEPRTAFALGELSALAYARDDRVRGRAYLDRALAASPRDPTLRAFGRAAKGGQPWSVEKLNDGFLAVSRARVGK